MASPEEIVKLVIAESERLTQYLTTLPPEAWNKPSACDRWEVRDVVTHLAAQAEHYAAWIVRSLQGDASTPEGLPAPGSVNAASYAESSAQRVIARRERLGDQVLAYFLTTNDQLNRLLASLGPQDWEKPHYYVSLGIAPMRFRPANRFSELVIHSWDIRSRFEPDASLAPESLSALLELMVTSRTSLWTFRPGSRLSAPVRYRFAVTGAVPRRVDIVVAGDHASIAEAGDAAASVTFHCDPETYVLMRYGRRSLEAARAMGRLRVEGDQTLVVAYAQWFKGA